MSERIPVEGEKLTGADGTVWLIESVSLLEPDEYIEEGAFAVEIVKAADADDMQAMSYDLTDAEFEEFCEAQGIDWP